MASLLSVPVVACVLFMMFMVGLFLTVKQHPSGPIVLKISLILSVIYGALALAVIYVILPNISIRHSP